MRRTLLILAGIIFSSIMYAQAPEIFNYQAVLRNDAREPITNQSVGIKIAILKGSSSGNIVYSETHNPTTNDYGLINLKIGAGTTSDDLSLIDWGADTYYMEISLDESGGSTFDLMGTSQLLSVPYALHAKTAETVSGAGITVLRLTNEEIDALNPSQGAFLFNTTEKIFQVFDGSSWYAMQSQCWPEPTIANAGEDLLYDESSYSVTLAANTPDPGHGSGKWSIIAGDGGSFSDDTNPNTSFTGIEQGIYTLRWTISTSCGSSSDDINVRHEEPVTPTIQFVVEVDGYTATMTAEATDAESWLWDYGDGNTSTTAGSHEYSYEDAGSGTYTIACTVTSKDDLTATSTQSVSITAPLEELIAGVGTEGKTWVLTQVESNYTGKMGAGGVTNDVAIYPNMSLVPNNVLGLFGLGDEYTDEFTFYRDGTLAIDLKNGRSLVGIVYGNILSPGDIVQSSSYNDLPLASIPGTNITDATWSLSYADRTVDWYDEFVTQDLAQTALTFPENDPDKIAELVLSEGAYVCFNDLYYPEPYATALGLPGPVDNSIYILKEVTANMMNIAVGINQWPDYPQLPSLLLHLTLVPKQ